MRKRAVCRYQTLSFSNFLVSRCLLDCWEPFKHVWWYGSTQAHGKRRHYLHWNGWQDSIWWVRQVHVQIHEDEIRTGNWRRIVEIRFANHWRSRKNQQPVVQSSLLWSAWFSGNLQPVASENFITWWDSMLDKRMANKMAKRTICSVVWRHLHEMQRTSSSCCVTARHWKCCIGSQDPKETIWRG